MGVDLITITIIIIITTAITTIAMTTATTTTTATSITNFHGCMVSLMRKFKPPPLGDGLFCCSILWLKAMNE